MPGNDFGSGRERDRQLLCESRGGQRPVCINPLPRPVHHRGRDCDAGRKSATPAIEPDPRRWPTLRTPDLIRTTPSRWLRHAGEARQISGTFSFLLMVEWLETMASDEPLGTFSRPASEIAACMTRQNIKQ